jgi:hypothetical protein
MSFDGREVFALGIFGLGGPEVVVLIIGGFIVYGVIRQLRQGTVVGFASAGAVVGLVLGFLFRPSVPFVGQLPLGTVLSRGSNLSGMDMILRSVAEQSFNYMIVGAILCAAIMAGVRYVMLQNAARPTTVPASPAPTPPMAAAATAPGGNSFCTSCGTPLGDGITFCGKCGTKRG